MMETSAVKNSKKNNIESKATKRPSKSPAYAKGKRKKPMEALANDPNTTEAKKEEKPHEEAKKSANTSINNQCFKNPKYKENGYVIQTKIWKNLKQIMATQKSQSSPEEITYASIDAPPSLIPAKKYSDISGLPALYTDPHTRLRYTDSDEYRKIQHISSDTVTGLLALRKAYY